MKKILLFAVYILGVFAVNAEDVIVFRKDGSANLFNKDRLVEIECSSKDGDGNDCGEICYQHFIEKDTTYVIPIAEIDSVTFGSRNSIVPKKNVRRILDSELPYITNFDGTTITYGAETLASAIPSTGTLIYYDNFCDIFPYGLSAKVKSVRTDGGLYKVTIEEVDPKEIFDSYFITGDFDVTIPVEALSKDGMHRAKGDNTCHPFELGFNKENAEFKIVGTITVSFRNLVASVLTGYYHADIDMAFDFDMDTELRSDNSKQYSNQTQYKTLFRTPVGTVLYSRLDMAGFIDLEAKLRLKYNMHRSFNALYEWTRKNGQNTFVYTNNSNKLGYTNTSSIDLLLEGSAHLGLLADLSLNTLFDRGGAGVSAKIGPKLSGEFGIGVVNDLSQDYDLDLYTKSHIDVSMNAKFESYYYYLDNIAWGNVVRNTLPFELNLDLFKHTLYLLPELDTRAVRTNALPVPGEPHYNQAAIDIASVTETPIEHSLEMGYEIVDKRSNEVIAQQFVTDSILSNTEEKQGFNERIPIGNIDSENVYARPIIKYADSVIKCRPANISDDAAINSIFAHLAKSGSYFVAGAPVIGQTAIDSTTFIVGNILPIVQSRRNLFDKNKRTFKTCTFINERGAHGNNDDTIYGVWNGEFNGKPIHVVLNDNNTASYNNLFAVMNINNPQSGAVRLAFDDGRTLLLFIHEISASTMKISFENSNELITLTR